MIQVLSSIAKSLQPTHFFSATVQQYGNNNQVPFYEVIARITEIFVKKAITIKNKRYVKPSVRNVSISRTAVEK